MLHTKNMCIIPSMPIDTLLTGTELDRLDDFLMRDDAPENTMDTSMLDGYLAAVASGPNLVMPDQMLRWVWDTENAKRVSDATANLILRQYQDVNDALNDQNSSSLKV